jgi:hypothetical protein
MEGSWRLPCFRDHGQTRLTKFTFPSFRVLCSGQERGFNYYPFEDMFFPYEPDSTSFRSLVLFTAGRSGSLTLFDVETSNVAITAS